MIFIGMIYRYDTTQGIGDLMLPDGEKREFSAKEWTDSLNAPSVGQKIAYEQKPDTLYIRVATEEDIKQAEAEKNAEKVPVKEETPAQDETQQFTDIDECIQHFTNMGLKAIKDTQDGQTRTVSLRSYVMGDFAEAIITQSGSKITVVQTLNGKTVTSSL
ncbi:MAG: hypothetical protein U9Q40_04935 [Campylobacterota bacterium]|nr:hypothetical protein [Campylobacterota bacterium]